MSDEMPGFEEIELQTRLMGSALCAYAVGEREKGFEFLEQWISRPSTNEIVLLFTLANWIVNAEGDAFGPERFHGFGMVNVITGETVNPDGFSDPESKEAVMVWCMRMLTATANRDHEQQSALLSATPDEHTAALRLRMMLHLGAETMRGLMEKEQGRAG